MTIIAANSKALCSPTFAVIEQMLGLKIRSFDGLREAAQQLLSYGYKNIIIQGGYLQNEILSYDYWTNGDESFWLTSVAIDNKKHSDTSTFFSSAINAAMTLGYTLKDAIVLARMTINRKKRLSLFPGSDPMLREDNWPEEESDLPFLANDPLEQLPSTFPDCNSEPLGLYPIVDSCQWLELLLPLGVKTLQLRIKNKGEEDLKAEVKHAVRLSEQFKAKLFINDHWKLALAEGAYGVHLGQEDLHSADMVKIRQGGLRLGLSTHCYYEVARAHALRPSYIACGPIFATTSKQMSFMPQGLFNLQRWRKTLKSYPLIAIGGMNLKNSASVLATGVDGIALISAITHSQNPIEQTKALLALF